MLLNESKHLMSLRIRQIAKILVLLLAKSAVALQGPRSIHQQEPRGQLALSSTCTRNLCQLMALQHKKTQEHFAISSR